MIRSPKWWASLTPWDKACAKVNAVLLVCFVAQVLVELWAK